MKLITKEIEKRFQEIGSQQNELDPVVIIKFFNPVGAGTWYATEYDKTNNICFGFVTGLGFDEWGSFSIDELEDLILPLGLSIERDMYSQEKTISQHCPELIPIIERQKEVREIESMQKQKERSTELER